MNWGLMPKPHSVCFWLRDHREQLCSLEGSLSWKRWSRDSRGALRASAVDETGEKAASERNAALPSGNMVALDVAAAWIIYRSAV